jgi:CheY-like chemotaxis protein
MEKDSTILFVDDSEEDRELMRYAFKKAHVPNPVVELQSGEEAIHYLAGDGEFAERERYPLPCLIITDLKMPRVDGFELLEWLRARPEFHRVPKIVLSASDEEGDRARARELGACAYFVKPTQLNELVAVVRKMDEEWISENCPLVDA